MGFLIAKTEVRSYNRTYLHFAVMHLGALQIFKSVQTVISDRNAKNSHIKFP